MNKNRPVILSIAGFDPSAGAGILADIKTCEALGIYGMAVVSALTYQNDTSFEKVEWMQLNQIKDQIEILQKRSDFEIIKIGLIENLKTLDLLIDFLLSKNPKTKLIWDPILKASAGFEFYKNEDQELLEKICARLFMITPNIPEAIQLGISGDAKTNAKKLSSLCNVFLKGGHSEKNKGSDILYTKDQREILFAAKKDNFYPKHGSGCVLSSAIAANLAKDLPLEEACWDAKAYISSFLSSNASLLGFHKNLNLVENG